MKTKREFIQFKAHEREAFQSYLNTMAKQGWHISKIHAWYISFEQSDEKCYYYVDLNEEYPCEISDVREEKGQKKDVLYEQLGYSFVCVFQLFVVYKSKEKKEDLYSDPQLQEQLIQKVMKKEKRQQYVPILMIFISFLIYFMLDSRLMYSIYMKNLFLFLSLIVCFLIEVFFIFKKKKQRTINYTIQIAKGRIIILAIRLYEIVIIALLSISLLSEVNHVPFINSLMHILTLVYISTFIVRIKAIYKTNKKSMAIIKILLGALGFIILFYVSNTFFKPF